MYLLSSDGFGHLYTDETWLIVKNLENFKEVIEWVGLPKRISFDHDLGELKGKVLPNGYDCCKWLVEYCLDNNLELTTECKFHTANPVGRANMESLINNYKKNYVQDKS